ncbi:hypothetical protein [Viscerimonas tarda]
MKKFKYILLVCLLIGTHTTVDASAGVLNDGWDLPSAPLPSAQLPSAQLPSDAAMDRIQQLTGQKDLRDKPGGGPGIGEVVIPVTSSGAINVLIMLLLYISVVLFRTRKNKKRFIEQRREA